LFVDGFYCVLLFLTGSSTVPGGNIVAASLGAQSLGDKGTDGIIVGQLTPQRRWNSGFRSFLC